jgi:hypothetical protein
MSSAQAPDAGDGGTAARAGAEVDVRGVAAGAATGAGVEGAGTGLPKNPRAAPVRKARSSRGFMA